jgi:hypothetical protein
LVTPHTTTDLAELLERGHQSLDAGDASVAAEHFETARPLCDPTTEPWVLYWAALAHEAAGRHELAAERFELLAERHARHELGPDAAVRAVRLWGYLEQGARAAQLGLVWLPRGGEFTVEGRIALHAAVALHELEQENLAAGELHVGKARQWALRRRLAEASVLSRDVATMFFALGELRRHKAERIDLATDVAQFADRFEQRAQLVLDAQSAYLDVMRARDAFWTSRAGLRLGELYTRLHTAVMRAPRPSREGTDPRLFEGAFRLRYLVLLEKGLGVLDRTLTLTERTNEQRPWVEAAKQERARLQALLADEERFLAELPWSKRDLRAVLDGIAARQAPNATPRRPD